MNLSQAAAAGEQVVELCKIASSEALLDDVEAPFTAASGELEGLGDFAVGDDDLGNLGDLGKALAGAVTALDPAGLADGSTLALQMVAEKAAAVRRTGIAACSSVPDSDCEQSTICIDATVDPNINLVTIQKSSCQAFVSREQRFHVDNNGTPQDGQDDQIRSFWSMVEHNDGSEIELSMQAREGDFIVDHVLVDVIEVIRPGRGRIEEQTNTISLNVGMLDTDNDEVIWSLSSEQILVDGSANLMTVTDGNQDGIVDNDELVVTSQFRAAAANKRLDMITSTIQILVHSLVDPSDDQLASLSRTLLFDGETSMGTQASATTTFVPEQPVSAGEEPCGGVFEKHATFPAGLEAQSLDRVIDLSCAGGGTSVLEVVFSDETNMERTIAWSGSGQVTIIETGRDGTIRQGSVDRQAHSFSIDTTFPAGNDPVSISHAGSSDRAAGTRSYDVVVSYRDGHEETLHVTAQRDEGGRSLSGHATDARGRVDFELVWERETQTLSGSSSGPGQESGTFTLMRQDDGGSDLMFSWADPSKDITVEGSAQVAPDGSGCGEMTVRQAGTTTTTTFCFGADGNGTIADGAGGEIVF